MADLMVVCLDGMKAVRWAYYLVVLMVLTVSFVFLILADCGFLDLLIFNKIATAS